MSAPWGKNELQRYGAHEAGATKQVRLFLPPMSTAYRKIGIIREGKEPADRRVPLTPAQCKEVMQRHPEVDLVVQRSPVRAFTDAEYEAFEIPLVDELGDRDLIMGVKEVPLDMLLPKKAYLFFSHTIKEQPQPQAVEGGAGPRHTAHRP